MLEITAAEVIVGENSLKVIKGLDKSRMYVRVSKSAI